MLGGVAIEYEKSLAAHSDGDVALHALCDALLGAAAMGDIGKHFPDTDQHFKGIDSRILLRNVCAKLTAQGYAVGNVDVTIVAQLPKLAPYIDRMRATIATDLQIEIDAVNVKATTTEGMGFEGRGEGISACAVALLQKT
jgi:2-C-methyl-D-erythritol 2,4-cyclodiphosphate synthase